MTVCHMPWILFIEPLTECARSERIRTDTRLDQDCVLKATRQVCTPSLIVSLLTTCMNFKSKKNIIFPKNERKTGFSKSGIWSGKCLKRHKYDNSIIYDTENEIWKTRKRDSVYREIRSKTIEARSAEKKITNMFWI